MHVKMNGALWVKKPYMKNNIGIEHDINVSASSSSNSYPESIFNMSETKIPKGEYFMMGDNRDHSNDSRFWGSLKKSLIIGKLKK